MKYFRRAKKEGRAELLGYKASFLHFPARNAKATLVCFHGWLDNAASFVPLAEALPDYEIFAWDFLGHGKSAHRHRGERYHFVDLVPFVDAAIAHTGREDVILTGHSMGAGAAALYAGAIGRSVGRLFLIEGLSPMTAEADDAGKILAAGVSEFTKAASLPKPVYAGIADALRIRMRVNGLSAIAARPLVERATMRVQKGITWRADFRLRAPSLLRMTPAQVRAVLGSIGVPALLVLGESGMPELTRAVEADNELREKFHVSRLPGHHHLHMDHAPQVAAVFREFMERPENHEVQE